MKKFLLSIISVLLFCTNLYALPKCPGEKRVMSTWVNCNGSYTAVDGHYYSGDFDSEGKYTGYGTLKNKGGVYKGEFLNDRYHGQGWQSLDSASGIAYYEGEFFMGNWHGQGKLWSKDGVFKYEGEFQNMQMTGYGTLTYEGISVTGNWKNGECNDNKTCEAVKAAKSN